MYYFLKLRILEILTAPSQFYEISPKISLQNQKLKNKIYLNSRSVFETKHFYTEHGVWL